MTEQNNKNRARKVAAGSLLGLGVLGIGLAAASQLTLGWQGTFQAGAVTVNSECQNTDITVSFDSPEFEGTKDVPWTIANVNFDSIDPECVNSSYEIAYKTADSDWNNYVTGGTISQAGVLTAALPSGVIPEDISDFALTIYDDGDN